MRAGLPLGLLVAAAFGVSGAAVAAPRTYTVAIDKMRFATLPAVLHRGDVVMWVNRDLFRHTVTARNRGFDLDLAPGATGRIVLRKPGTFAYYCRFHPGMTGQLTVAP